MKHIKKQILSNVTERSIANNLEHILRLSQKSLKRELAEELKSLAIRILKLPMVLFMPQGKFLFCW